MTWSLQTDGGARGNPGPSAAAWVVTRPDGTRASAGASFLGVSTNNVAEYEALERGLVVALESGARSIEVRCDSELVVRQLQGTYRVRSGGLRPHFENARALLARFDEACLVHVRRESNRDADELVNAALDLGADVGDPPTSVATRGQAHLFE